MLSDSLSDSEEACSDVTIAALVALVLFDVRIYSPRSVYALTWSVSLSMMKLRAFTVIEMAYTV